MDMFKTLSQCFIDHTKEHSTALKTLREFTPLIVPNNAQFKELTIEDFKKVNADCVIRNEHAAKEKLKQISAQINLAKFENLL